MRATAPPGPAARRLGHSRGAGGRARAGRDAVPGRSRAARASTPRDIAPRTRGGAGEGPGRRSSRRGAATPDAGARSGRRDGRGGRGAARALRRSLEVVGVDRVAGAGRGRRPNLAVELPRGRRALRPDRRGAPPERALRRSRRSPSGSTRAARACAPGRDAAGAGRDASSWSSRRCARRRASCWRCAISCWRCRPRTSSRPASGRAPARRSPRERDWCHDAAPVRRSRRVDFSYLVLRDRWKPLAGPAALPRRQRSAAREGPPAALRLRPDGPPRVRAPRPPRSAAERRLRRARARRRRPIAGETEANDGMRVEATTAVANARRAPRRAKRGRGHCGRAIGRGRAGACAGSAAVVARRSALKSFTIVPSKDPHALSPRAGVVGRMAAARHRHRAARRPFLLAAGRRTAAERGRVKAGIFFAGAYLVDALGVRPSSTGPCPRPTHHDWLRVLAVLLFCFAVGHRAGLLLFDVVLVRREIPRILRDLVQGIALLHHGRDRADPVRGRRHQGVHGVGAHDGGHRPRAAGHAGQRHGRPGAAARARLRGRRLDQPRRRASRGRIREVRWRATTIVTKNGDLMLIPNAAITRAHDHQLQPADHGAPAVGPRARPFPPPAGAGARGDRRGGAGAAVRARRARARLHAAGVQGGRLHLRVPLLDRRRPARRHRSTATCAAPSGTRCTGPGMEIPFPSRNINVTEMNEDRVQRKHDEEYARRVDALSRVDVFRALDAEKIDRLARRLRHVDVRPGRGDPAPGRSGRLALRRARRARWRCRSACSAPQGGRDAGRRAVLRRDVADDRRVAHRDRRREDRRRVLHRRQGGVPGDRRRRSPSWPAIISDILSRRQVVLGAKRPLDARARPPRRRTSSARRSPRFSESAAARRG